MTPFLREFRGHLADAYRDAVMATTALCTATLGYVAAVVVDAAAVIL